MALATLSFATALLASVTAPVKVEDAGAMYAAWCRANQGKAGVPVIYGITKFTGCYLVLMKRYDPVREVWRMGPRITELRTAMNQTPPASADPIVHTAHSIGLFFGGVADPDIHEGNVMIDPDTGELIITDPISFGPCSRSGSSYYSTGTI